MRILIADDEPGITGLLKDALVSSNHTVDITDNDDVITPFQSGDYDCIIKYYYAPGIITFGDLKLSCDSFKISCGTRSARLTRKEYSILKLLMLSPQVLFSTEALMERFWGRNGNTEINVVWTNIGYLRRKIESIGAHAEIRAFRGRGYQISETRS